ncbi:MAG TPA: ABC transporter substrate-binding protein [Chitinophagaceae bacterium]|nr:ABC transporter substrate-binding protein [Chitinophagaceae bacterium]
MNYFFLVVTVSSFAQPIKHKIAILAPLYLDSAFDDQNNYRYDKLFPKFINPGLEFYEGAQLALDSLSKENAPLEVFVYDTRSSKESLAKVLENVTNDSVELILAYSDLEESWNISNTARSKKIPYINVNLPNDAGITANPYFVMMNATLQTHIDRIYKYIQKYYALRPIIVFRKKGKMEDVIKSYLDNAGKTTASVPLKINYVDLNDSFTVNQLTSRMDSNQHSLYIDGSLDENFGRRLCQQLASVSKSYPLTLMGMPTFDNLTKDFTGPQYKGLEIIYSTPFYNFSTDKVSQYISDNFNTKMYARPSDMVMRGYEATWRFSKLLLEYGKDLSSNLSRKEFNVFRELDIQPVVNKQTMALDYFENEKLFFIKWQDGIIKGVN